MAATTQRNDIIWSDQSFTAASLGMTWMNIQGISVTGTAQGGTVEIKADTSDSIFLYTASVEDDFQHLAFPRSVTIYLAAFTVTNALVTVWLA